MIKQLLLATLALGIDSSALSAAESVPAGAPATASTTVAASAAPLQAAQGLIGRLLPQQAAQFTCEVIPNENGKDVFEIEAKDGKVVLRGNNGVSLASALNWYLKYSCNCHVSWCGDQLKLPTPLPALAKFRKVSPHQYRYAFNYCTFGYAMAFWDWQRWEREIDYMALNGINCPLAATGMEVIYRNVYRSLGVSEEGIAKFIAAPPYLPWFLMGNLDGFGGPNPDAWYERQEALQKKILERERAFGMKPILPAFGGHVPQALSEKFPTSKIDKIKPWGGFPSIYLLKPEDPLFRDIGARFIKETIKVYGTDHLYSADTFNEMVPPSSDPAYLKNVNHQVYQAMADADPAAIWFMQGWLFLFDSFWTQPRIEAFLSGVPDDKMVIIDLFSDAKPVWNQTKAYGGKPWIWCIVHNWGGKQGMYGRLSPVGVTLPNLLGKPEAGKLVGTGTLNEGNDVNPLVYEQLYEMAWRDQPMDVKQWVQQYAERRYGKKNASAQKAWEILGSTLYECKDNRHGPQGNYLAMPATMAAGGNNFVRASIFYNTGKVRDAFKLLLDAAPDLASQASYQFDLVDLGRQVMSDLSQGLHKEIRDAAAKRDLARFDKAVAAWYAALDDCDTLLRSNTMFQLGRYLQYPRHAVADPAANAQFERNAKRIITQWGPNSHLTGYAQRQYGGLMRDLNKAAWKAQFDAVRKSITKQPKGNESVWNTTEQWIKESKEYPVQGEGDPVAAAKMIWAKYGTKIKAVDAAKQPVDLKHHE